MDTSIQILTYAAMMLGGLGLLGLVMVFASTWVVSKTVEPEPQQ